MATATKSITDCAHSGPLLRESLLQMEIIFVTEIIIQFLRKIEAHLCLHLRPFLLPPPRPTRPRRPRYGRNLFCATRWTLEGNSERRLTLTTLERPLAPGLALFSAGESSLLAWIDENNVHHSLLIIERGFFPKIAGFLSLSFHDFLCNHCTHSNNHLLFLFLSCLSKKRPSDNGNATEKVNGVSGSDSHAIDSSKGPSASSSGNRTPDDEDQSATDFRFIGEGILVGKSALKSGAGKKLRISFDDNAICYEYPSEQVRGKNVLQTGLRIR